MNAIFQNLEFDPMAEINRLRGLVEPVVVVMPMPHEKPEYIFGLIKETKPGEVKAPGTRFQPPAYRFINGKREPNRRQRFGQR